MRVCMLAYSFYESDTRIRQYATALVERGDTVDVLALLRPGQPKYEFRDGVNIYRIQRREINERWRFEYAYRVTRFLLVSMMVLTRKHLASPYQVIHVHSVPDFLVFGALVPKMLGARVILDIHDLLPEFNASKFRAGPNSIGFKCMVLAEKLSCAFADHVIVANDLWLERLIGRSVRANKCIAIRNYPQLALFRTCAKRKKDKFLITYPGSLNKHQGLDVAIHAFARVADQMPDAEFHIYGEGPDKSRLMRLTETLHLDDRVFFHNILPAEEIAQVMADTDLAIEPKLTSWPFSNEAASTKILEFMAAGVPIVASRTAIHARYYDDSMVRFYDSDSEADLAECIFSLWRDEDDRKQLVRQATKYVEENNWEARKWEYLRLVDAISLQN